MSPRTRAAVLGHPVGHSLSPVLHRAAYAALGLASWTYDVVDVTSEQLPGFVADLDGSWGGLSLTMPLKQTVLPLLDHVEPLAGVVGAVNTVLFAAGGSRPVLTGANTDVHGIVAALREGLAPSSGPVASGPVASAAVLGAGATAASTMAALAELGCPEPAVYVRSLARTAALRQAAHRMGVHPRFVPLAQASDELGAADVVVSTLPAHAADDVAGALAGPTTGVLLDVVYEPRPTALSAAWGAAGGVVVGGERMLLHQAAEQVRLMTGRAAPLAAMDAALRERLGG